MQFEINHKLNEVTVMTATKKQNTFLIFTTRRFLPDRSENNKTAENQSMSSRDTVNSLRLTLLCKIVRDSFRVGLDTKFPKNSLKFLSDFLQKCSKIL